MDFGYEWGPANNPRRVGCHCANTVFIVLLTALLSHLYITHLAANPGIRLDSYAVCSAASDFTLAVWNHTLGAVNWYRAWYAPRAHATAALSAL